MGKKMKVSLYPIISVLLYVFCVVRLSYIDNLNIISLIVCSGIFVYLVFKGAIFKNKAYSSINIWLYLFCFFALISCIINFKNFDGTILFLIKLVDIVMFIEYVNEIEEGKKLSKYFFFTSLLLGIISIVYANTHPLSVWYNDLNYMIGTKFTLSYNMIGSIIFYLYGFQKQKNRIIHYAVLILLFMFSLYTSISAGCATGTIGNIVLLALLIITTLKNDEAKFSFFLKPNSSIIIILMGTTLVFLMEKIIINVPIINYLVTSVFEKSADLSGRTIIYEKVFSYFKDHILFGYGYNNVYDLFKNTMEIRSNVYAYNAQNALLEYLLYYGIIGSSFFLLFIKNCFKRLKDIKKDINKKYFIIGFYILIFMGIVEPTFNFFLIIFITYIACGKKDENKNSEIQL